MTRIFPILIGAGMGPIMLWMMHDTLVSGATPLAALAFVGAHVAIAALLVAAVLLGPAISPRWRARIARLHRPSAGHLALMLSSAAATAGFVHMIHGGPI